jgi:CRP-like cAMP-binding protein
MTHELRVAQRRSIMMAHRSARGRLAMFVKMLQTDLELEDPTLVPLAMSRADIASYLGLSPEAVSRGTRLLVKAGVVSFQGPRVLKVLLQQKIDEFCADH